MERASSTRCVVALVDRVLWAMVALAVAVPRPGWAQVVKATDAMRKIKTTTNLANIPTSASAAMSAAKNDFEAFQIVIQGPANNVSATATALTGPGTALSPAACGSAGQIRLYQEAIINISTATPGFNGGTGGYPDALIPNVDEFDQQCRSAFGFNVPSGQNRVIWVEVYVPPDRAAGSYSGQVTVTYTGGSTTIPVQLEVWDFALPPAASLRSYFALAWPEVQTQHPNAPCCGSALSQLRARYSALALDHRISTPHFDDGMGTATWDNYDTYMGPLINGTAATRIPGAAMTSMDLLGGASPSSAASHFSTNGWFGRLFEYAADEPGSQAPHRTPWEQIAPNCDNVHGANSDFRALVVSTFQHVNDPSTTDNPPSPAIPVGFLPPKINILVPNIVELESTSGNTRSQYDSWQASRLINEVWQYISCSSYSCGGGSTLAWPTYVIDASMMQARALEWISFKNRITGELYFDTGFAYAPDTGVANDPWTNQFFFGGNGDGTLFYPGTPTRVAGGTDIPIASLRMKMIREGMEDYELLNILASQNDRAFAVAQVNALFPSGSQVDQDPAALYNARKQLACRILQNMGKPSSCNPNSQLLSVNPNGGVGTGTVTSNPVGINCGTGGSVCQFSFPTGTVVALSASADAGSSFSGYSGDCTGTTCSVTMSAPKNVTATFTKPCSASDCFNRPDSANLGPNWNTYGPALQITSGQATNTDPNGKESQWLTSIGADQDVAVDCKVTGAGSNCGLMARWADSSNYYYAYLDSGLGTVDLWRKQAGVVTKIGSAPRSIAANAYYHLRLVVQGSTLSVYFNGETTATISLTDTALTAGNFGGLHAFAGGAQSVWYGSFDIKAAGSTTFAATVTKTGNGSGTVTSSPAGIDCGTGCSATFPGGSAVTLTAAPSSGSSFGGFSNGCTSSSTTCTFSITANTAVNAAFALNDFSMSVNPTSASAAQGSTASYSVSTQLTSGAAQTVTFSATGLPAGATASFNPASVTAGAASSLTVTVGSSTATGTYGFNIVGTGTSTTKSISATLVVTAPGSGIAFRAMSTYFKKSTSTTSINLVVPAAVQANDVLLANVFAGDYPGSSLPTVTAPSGWTLVRQVSHGTAALLQIYSRVATATDPGTTYSWTTSFFVGSASSLVAYSGASGAVDASAAQDNPSAAATYSTPAVTTTAAGDLLLATYAGYNNVSSPTTGWSAPAGMTQRVFLNNSDGTGGALLSLSNDDKVQAAAGASGTFASTATPGQNYALTALVALKPAGAPPPPPAISFRASSTYIRQSTSTMHIDLVVPASVQANDVLIANIFAGDYVSNVLPTITAPAGWTLVRQVSHGSEALLQIYSRVASASDAGTTQSWTTNVWVGSASSLVAYSGASAAAPVDVSGAQDNATAAASYSTPAVTTTAAGDLLLATYAGYNNVSSPTTSWTAPAGMTQRVFVNNTEGTVNGLLSLSNDDKIQSAAGATGTFSSTATPGQNYALTALVALKR